MLICAMVHITVVDWQCVIFTITSLCVNLVLLMCVWSGECMSLYIRLKNVQFLQVFCMLQCNVLLFMLELLLLFLLLVRVQYSCSDKSFLCRISWRSERHHKLR